MSSRSSVDAGRSCASIFAPCLVQGRARRRPRSSAPCAALLAGRIRRRRARHRPAHPCPRRRLAGRPLAVQRRARGARRGGLPSPGRRRRRPRVGRHPGRLRGRRSRRHAIGRRGAGRPVAGRAGSPGWSHTVGGWMGWSARASPAAATTSKQSAARWRPSVRRPCWPPNANALASSSIGRPTP